MNGRNFFAELKRRNVYKVAVAYAVVAWLLIQIATQVFPFFEIPNWCVRLVVLLLILGFPVALVFSWAFELTSEGIQRTAEIAPNEPIRRRTSQARDFAAALSRRRIMLNGTPGTAVSLRERDSPRLDT